MSTDSIIRSDRTFTSQRPWVLFLCQTLTRNRLAASRRVRIIIEEILRCNEKLQVVALTMEETPESDAITISGHERLRLFSVPFIKPEGLTRVFSKVVRVPDAYSSWSQAASDEALRICCQFGDPLMLFASSPPHSIQLAALKIHKTTGVKFIADFRDDWSHAHRAGYLTPIHRLLARRMEHAVLRSASVVIQAIPLVANEWQSKMPDPTRVRCITNGCSDREIERAAVKHFADDSNSRIISYFGGGYGQYVSRSLEYVANELRRRRLHGSWKIVSGGDFQQPEGYSDVWEHRGILDPVEVQDIEFNSSVQLSLLPPGDKSPSRTIPAKLYTHLLNPGWIVFIGAPGATNEILAEVPRATTFGNKCWSQFIDWLDENSHTQAWRERRINLKTEYHISARFGELIREQLGQSLARHLPSMCV